MIWSRIDRLTGADPLSDFDHAIQARVAIAFAVIMSSLALINSAIIGFSGVARPGMVPLAVGSGIVFALIGVAGVRWRKPNLSIAAILVIIGLNMALATWANRGSFPPAGIYIPAMLLGVLMAWGARYASLMLLPVFTTFAGVMWLGREYAGTSLEMDAQAILPALVLATAFACVWVVILGSAYRTATASANEELARKNAELADTLEAAKAASRAKSDFLANMGHEIRTPLNGVLGMANVLLHEGDLKPEQVERLEMINESGADLLDLLNDLLDLSKMEAGRLKLEQVDYALEEIVNSAARSLAPLAEEKGLNVSVRIGDLACPVLRGDPIRVRQILNNLIGNAIKFTREGEVTIEVRQSEMNSELLYPLEIAVIDTGIGISKEKQATVFEAFSQADASTTRQYGGTGLGLAICARLAAEMDGRLDVDSVPGAGSRFTLQFLARGGDQADEKVETGPGEPVTVDRDLRLLVVDDVSTNQIVIASLIKQSLVGGQVEIDVASSGREAINMASATRYDAILMDIQMPEMDGMTAMRCIRETRQGRDSVIVAVTAMASLESETALRASGFTDYLPKPVEVGALRQLLERLFRTPTARKSA